MRKATSILAALVASVVALHDANAGGYDTPVFYSARHLGMGGTGIAFVYDPTALFMNPAGLQHTPFISVTGNFTPLLANIDSPVDVDDSIESTGITLGPAFLVGGAFRVTDFLVLGVGAYPVASAGGTYHYTKNGGDNFTDETNATFIEISPGIAFHMWDVSIGFGYRVTLGSLKRYKKNTDGDGEALFDMDVFGVNAEGFRLGVQWQPLDYLQLGFVYRHRIDIDAKQDNTELLGAKYGETSLGLTLPSRLGVGARTDFPIDDALSLGIAVDWEYAFQSQNGRQEINARKLDDTGSLRMPVFFMWKDAQTVRVGAELTIEDTWRARLGYIWDQETTNREYPTAFGTPPADTHIGTAGFGYRGSSWEANLAYVFRHGQADIDADELGSGCLTCSKAGHYELNLHGISADFSWYFD